MWREIAAFLLICAPASLSAQQALPTPDPVIRPDARLDPRRPMDRELATTIADGFTLALVGDMIIARPLSKARPVPGFEGVLGALRGAAVTFGNLETSLVDMRIFKGAPYPFDGDWANISEPAVAEDLRAMGFDIVGRANNHVMDWGLEGMRETGAHLDEAGIVHAGTGETAALARQPAYLETPQGRVALVSFATTFRPTTEAMPPRGASPARPGLSALHLKLRVHVVDQAMASLAAADCAMNRKHCGGTPDTLTLRGTTYVRDTRNFNEWVPDVEDMAEILRNIREARQHADFVLVAVHAHECAWVCDLGGDPLLPGDFLKNVARTAIDAGGDTFVATGIHNLGPIEIYRGRPIFYGLSNFFWSDIQEPVPHELFQMYRPMLERTYEHPERATDYDLTAPLNAESFATDYTFQSVIAQARFSEGRLAEINLSPVDLGYGDNLRSSGTPRLERDPGRARATINQIVRQNAAYGLPPLDIRMSGTVASVRAK